MMIESSGLRDGDDVPPLEELKNVLKEFVTRGEEKFRVVMRVGSNNVDMNESARVEGDLLVLDSSFNPPTKAHLNIVLSSLVSRGGEVPCRDRVLLLLSIQNADKAPQPASFEHRLSMMRLFAYDLLASLPHTTTPNSTQKLPSIEIGIIKQPYFLNKATELHIAYPSLGGEMIFLTGYDTLIRVLDAKYYGGMLEPLKEFFEGRNRVRCSYRPSSRLVGKDEWEGWKREQVEYLRRLKDGGMEDIGGRREWATKIELVDNGMDLPVSSTEVRTAVRVGDEEVLRRMLPEKVKQWIIESGLYRD